MELRNGYTTGTCAAIATRAALRMVFEGKAVDRESVITPSGEKVETEILKPSFSEGQASCAVKKDSGDDPDVTNGILIFSHVTLTGGQEIVIDGGEGIGRVTKPGLYQKVGEAAINKVPLQMIRSAAEYVKDIYEYEGGISIVISAPGGEEIAKKTFNPRLGIEGGISILGSSGIVKPMSEKAIIDTIKLEIDVRKAAKAEKLILTPGNYGLDYIKKHYDADPEEAVLCSNFVGEALDYAYSSGFKHIILIGHLGKFVKLAGGIMNTHSRNADCRMEILSANAAEETDDINVIRDILRCINVDEAVRILRDKGILEGVMKRIREKACFYVRKRLLDPDDLQTEILMFSDKTGKL